MLKKWIALAMAAVFVLSLSGAAVAAGKLVKVPTAWMDEHETFLMWYAKEKGWDKDAGLDVEIKYFNSGADILNALPSGEWVFAGMGAVPAMLGNLRYDTIIIGNGNDESMTNGVVVRKDSAYAAAASLADLAGAKITGQMSTFHYDMIDQIPGAKKMPAQDTFATMIVAVSSGAMDGYIADIPGAVSATSANPDLTYLTFAEGQGFTVDPESAEIAVGIRQGSELKAQINEILAGISDEERNEIMIAAVAAQPLSE